MLVWGEKVNGEEGEEAGEEGFTCGLTLARGLLATSEGFGLNKILLGLYPDGEEGENGTPAVGTTRLGDAPLPWLGDRLLGDPARKLLGYILLGLGHTFGDLACATLVLLKLLLKPY